MHTDKLIAKAKALAEEKYREGYDTFVECYDNADWALLVDGRTWAQVRCIMASCADVWNDRRADADHYREG